MGILLPGWLLVFVGLPLAGIVAALYLAIRLNDRPH